MNATFLQPFLAFTTKTYTTFTLNTESTYNWEKYEWTVPLNLMVAQKSRRRSADIPFNSSWAGGIMLKNLTEVPNGA